MEKNNKTGRIELKAYTTAELADMYEVARKTFYRWIKSCSSEIGPRVGSVWNKEQVKIIWRIFGDPNERIFIAEED
jgi:hypothetical protein